MSVEQASPSPADTQGELARPNEPGGLEVKRHEGSWKSIIIAQRHSYYDNQQPGDYDNLTSEEKATLGHLTQEGREAAAVRAKERVDALLDSGDDVDFLVITSPTHWLGHEDLGQRADETGQIISQTILAEIAARGGDPMRLVNVSGNIHGGLTRQHDQVEESRMFNNRQFTAFMRNRYGGQGREFWDAVNSDAHRELRESLGAEGPEEVAARFQRMIEVVARFSQYYENRNPGRRLATFIVTHAEDLEPYSQRRLGVTAEDFRPSYNDGIEIAIGTDGLATATVNGHEYPVALGGRSGVDRSESGV